MSIDTNPIFTNIGLNKMANAIINNSQIQLTTIKVGDCINDLAYQPTPSDTDIQNFVANTDVESTHYLDLKKSNNATLRVRGFIPYNLAQNYTIREYGVYDNEDDLIIIGRITDTELKVATSMKTEFELIVNISISDAQKAFIVNNVPSSDYVSKDDLQAHTEAANPHNLTREHFDFLNISNTSDLDKPTHPYATQMFKDIKLGLGFANRTDCTITKVNNNIILTPINPTVVYNKGVKHIIENTISVDTSNRPGVSGGYIGGYYIGYNPDIDSLYIIDDNPDFDNDILVTWFYRNSTQGIIWLADERHAASRNTDNHKLHHLEVGATWLDGGLLIATLKDDTNNKISITSPILIADEDLNHAIVNESNPENPYEQKLTNATLPVLYINSNGEYVVINNNNADINWLYNANGAVYNDLNTGTLVDVPSGKYLSYWMLFTNDQTEPVKLIVGRAAHDSLNAAGAEVLEDFGLPMPEVVGAYKIILYIDSSYNNLAKSRIDSVFEISNSTRKSSIKANSHTLLLDRDSAGQHTVNSIKGLSAALAGASSINNIGLEGTVKSKTTTANGSGDIIIDTYMSDSTNMVYKKDPVFTDLVGNQGGQFTGNDKWRGGVFAGNNNIYFVPNESRMVVEFNPLTKTAISIGSDLGTGKKFGAGVLAPNGNIYCPPYNTTRFLEINPNSKSTTYVGSDLGSSLGKWMCAILAPNGNIYCPPNEASQTLKFNPDIKSMQLIGDIYTRDPKWASGALAPNGKIYCPPYNATQVLEIDPNTDTTSLISTENGGSYSWIGAALAPNGRIYCAPYSAKQVMVIDPNTKITTLIGPDLGSEGNKYLGAVLAPNGKIYCTPYSSPNILEIDPSTNTVIELRNTYSGILKWEHGALASNGKIYCPPCRNGYILEIDPFSKATDYQAYLKLPRDVVYDYSGIAMYTFNTSITATVSTGILLADYVDPNSANEFLITVEEGVVLSGKQGNNGRSAAQYTGAFMDYSQGLGFQNYTTVVPADPGWTSENGESGKAGGIGMNLSGFSGKTLIFNILGRIKGGDGGVGGRGLYMEWGSGCNGWHTTYGGAGGPGGQSFLFPSGLSVQYMGEKEAELGQKGINGTNGGYRNPCPDGGGTCFTKGQLVLMADGTYLPIEDIRVGDKVQGAYGKDDINTVKYLDRPKRDDRTIYNICGLFTTDEHGILNGDKDGFLYLSIENHHAEQNMYHKCYDKDFNEIDVWFSGPQDGVTKKEDLVVGSILAGHLENKIVKEIVATDKDDDILYNLVLDGGSRTYCVSDIYVSGHTDDRVFDYKKGKKI